MTIDVHNLCKQIIELDSAIRFVGIPNKFGKQIVVEYRKGLTPLLTDTESELYKPIYSFTLYEKIKRTTISLDNKDYPILMVSFDRDADQESIILNKIIPFVKN